MGKTSQPWAPKAKAGGSSIKIAKSEIKKYLAKIGKRGGLKGGPARMASMTPEQRTELARAAAQARWSKKKGKRA